MASSDQRSQLDRGNLIEIGIVLLGCSLFVILFLRSWESPDQGIPAALSLDVPGAVEHWSGIYVEGQKIGYAVSRRAPTEDGSLLLQERMQLRLVLLGQPNDILVASDLRMSPAGALAAIVAQIKTELRGVPVSLRVEGKPKGRGLELSVQQFGAELTTIQLDDVPATPTNIYRKVLEGDPKVGDVRRVPWFSPLGMGQAEARVELVERVETSFPDGEETLAWRVRLEHSGQVVEAVVSPDGTRMSEREVEGGLGMSLQLETREHAIEKGWPGDAADTVDLIALSSIPLKGKLPDGGRTLRELRLGIEAPEHASKLLAARNGEAWDAEAGALHVRIPDPAASPSYSLPNVDRSMRPWLRPTTFSPSDHPDIKRQAGLIVGDNLDAHDAARKLTMWLYGNIEKVPVASIPSATEVLRSMRGDCNEHTTLFTALSRSLGIPTRPVAGIVYSESIFEDGAFYYHAWPEVWLGDTWVPVDPTFGQFPADATHVGLVEGELDKQMEIMGVIGRLKLTVLEAETP